MGEYIFRTENPIKCCEECPLIKDDGRCGLGAKTYSLGISISCPLIKIPPHGDLIKREDALTALMDAMCGTGYQSMAMSVIRSEMTCPTIIEASK